MGEALKGSRGRLLGALAVVAALAAVLAGYYLVHKPLTPAQALAYASTAANLAVAALLTGLGGGLGRRLLRGLWAREGAEDPAERMTLAVALGWGALALTVLTLGLVRALHAWLLWGLALAALWVVRVEVRAWARDLRSALRALAPAGRLDGICAVFVALILGLGALQAAAPPLKWDALVYHLTLPRRYLETHGLYLPLADFSLFTGMPQLGEMLYSAAHGLRLDDEAGSSAAQMVGWAAGALLVVGLAGAARARALPAWLAPAVLFSSYTVAVSLAWAYVELLQMLLALAMLLALDAWRRRGTGAWLALAGIYGGLAFGCKYTGAIVPLGGLTFIGAAAWVAGGTGGLRNAWRPAALLAGGAALLAAPWLAKNWLLTGSPVYPLLAPAADMDAARLFFYNRPDRIDRSLLEAGLIFWRAAFLGVQGGNEYDVTLGPLLVVLPLAAAAGWRVLALERRRALAPWAAFVLAAYGAWVVLTFFSRFAVQARLFFAVLPALALLAAAGWEVMRQLDTPSLRVSLVAAGGVVLVLALSANEVVSGFARQWPVAYLSGQQTPMEYRVSQLGGYPLAIEQVNALPAGARVVFLWEARSLSCRPAVTCVPDVVIDRWWHLRELGLRPDEVLARWRAEGVTHLLISEDGRQFVQRDPTTLLEADDWEALEAVEARLRVVNTVGEAYTLYALP